VGIDLRAGSGIAGQGTALVAARDAAANGTGA